MRSPDRLIFSSNLTQKQAFFGMILSRHCSLSSRNRPYGSAKGRQQSKRPVQDLKSNLESLPGRSQDLCKFSLFPPFRSPKKWNAAWQNAPKTIIPCAMTEVINCRDNVLRQQADNNNATSRRPAKTGNGAMRGNNMVFLTGKAYWRRSFKQNPASNRIIK